MIGERSCRDRISMCYMTVLVSASFPDTTLTSVIGGDIWEKSAKVLKPGGKFLTIVGDKEEKITLSLLLQFGGSYVNRNFWSLVSGTPDYMIFSCSPSGKQLEEIAELIEKEVIKPSAYQV